MGALWGKLISSTGTLADTISVGKTTGTTMELVDHDYAANNGHLLQTTYGNGDYINPVYDSLDRVVGMKYNGVEKYSWAFGADGQMGLLTDAVNNVEYRYEYDSAKRLTRILGKPGSTSSLPKTDFASNYNEKGQLIGITHKVASQQLKTFYVYDDYGRLDTERGVLGSVTTSNKSWVYDELGRVEYTDLRVQASGMPIVKTTYNYAAGVMPAVIGENKSNPTTSRVSGITLQALNGGWSEAYTYTYDDAGNITGIAKDGTTVASYAYDAMNQLIAATQNGITYNVSYDRGGNILSKTASAGNSHSYTYSHAVWKDLLTAVDGNAITYDEIGNPLTYYDGTAFTWEGRQMQSATIGSTAISYTYNSDGYRTSKTVNGVKTVYVLDGSKVIMEQTGTGTPIYYTYDSTGKPTTMTVGSTTYYYVYNLQGDIIAITNNNGIKVVEYTYDPWGKLISTTGSMASSIGVQNPYRYRAYRYDTELEMYYLNSRYYDPEIGRFINADAQIAGVGGEILGYNMFAYCMNNPVNMCDPTGNWPSLSQIFTAVVGAAIVAAAVAAVVVAAPVFATAVAAGCVGSAVVAGGTLACATVSALCGTSMIVESTVGVNPMRDALGQEAYDAAVSLSTAGTMMGVAAISTYTAAIQTDDGAPASPKHTTGVGSPNNNVNINGSFTKLDHKGNLYSYTQFDSFGRQSLRMDYQGRPHAGTLPHIHIFMYPERGGKIEYVFDMEWNLID